MHLEEIFPQLQTLLATDADLAAVPFLGQIASGVADTAQVREYNQRLEAALADPGLAFVAVVAEGEFYADFRGPVLDLANAVILSVVEKPKKNATNLTAYQYVRRALRVLHQGRFTLKGARTEVRLGKPAFNVGPLNQGTTVYFINLLVRTTEDLGALNPA